MRRKYSVGNAQTIGTFEVQSNYFSTVNLDKKALRAVGRERGCLLGVLADGGIDHVNGRNSAVIAVETVIHEFFSKEEEEGIEEFFQEVSKRIINNINDKIYLGKSPKVSLTITLVEEEYIYYFTVGENRLMLFDGEKLIVQKPLMGKFRLGPRQLVVMISKGVYTALNEAELINELENRRKPYDKAQDIIELVNRKNLKNALNSTIILFEGGL